MARVRFTKTLHVEQRRHAAGDEIDEAEVEPGCLESLRRLGHVEPVAPPAAGDDDIPDTDVDESEDAPVNLDALTVPELKDYAAANAIDLGDATKKADIIAAIVKAQTA
jgi:hypothetical protein